MAHIRQQIREAAHTVLSGSVAGLWNHVFKTRMVPSRAIFTFLMVYIDNETSSPSDIHNRIIDRDLTLSVRAFIRITDDEVIEEYMDAVSTEIETIMTKSAIDAELSRSTHAMSLAASSMAIDDETDRTAALLSLDWSVRVMTVEGQPETLV